MIFLVLTRRRYLWCCRFLEELKTTWTFCYRYYIFFITSSGLRKSRLLSISRNIIRKRERWGLVKVIACRILHFWLGCLPRIRVILLFTAVLFRRNKASLLLLNKSSSFALNKLVSTFGVDLEVHDGYSWVERPVMECVNKTIDQTI